MLVTGRCRLPGPEAARPYTARVDTTLSDPLVGRVLDGRYRVEARLARGGMATVYEAVDLRLERTIALKVMHPALADDDQFVARFIREARSAARLSHANVVAVYDQGDDHGTVYLAMEYVQGRTLRELLRRRGHLDPRTALIVFESVVAALAAAHHAGLVHRDMKPENVLLADDGRVKVADFGLARAISSASSVTAGAGTGGVLIGTVAYLAPEQVERGIAGPRSDVYAAGILLFEMLTGQTPHGGDTPLAVAYQHVHNDVPPPSTRLPGIPRALDELVADATSRDPDLRPEDAGVLLEEVRAIMRALDDPFDADADNGYHHTAVVPVTTLDPRHTMNGSAVATPPTTPAPPRRRRSRGPLALLVVLLLALVAGSVAWYLGAGPGRFTQAPSLLTLSRVDAEAKASAGGFSVGFAPEAFSETLPAGSVLEQTPEPSGRIRKGGRIELVLSAGPERYNVPNLVDKSLADATAELAKLNLVVGEITQEHNDEIATEAVISSDPAEGTQVRRDTPIKLVVSLGPEPVEVPSLIGRTVDEARDVMEDAELELETTEEFNDTVQAGRIVRQEPASGKIAKGSTVSAVVSKGPQTFEVPDVKGKSVKNATEQLEKAGFTVDVLGGRGKVLQQNPGPGSQHPKGGRVVLLASL
jgi:eukaryotic-like serine/threonine-protein kinase